jgi:hypothetical protein
LGPASQPIEGGHRWLGEERAARWEADTKLEALSNSISQVWDLVLERADGTSSLVALLSSVVELLEDCIDVVATNGICWGTRLALVAAPSHFLELGTELQLLGSGHNTDLMEDQVDTLWA